MKLFLIKIKWDSGKIQYSSGGVHYPKFTKNGKVWSSESNLRLHLISAMKNDVYKDFLDKLSIVKIELDEFCRCSEINFHEYIRINLK